MKNLQLSGFMLLLVVACIFASCSGGRNPVEVKSSEPEGLPDSIGVDVSDSMSNRSALAVYDAVIDPVAKTFTVTPSQRTADYHFPLTQLYPNVVQIVNYGWTPNFWADIKLTHPFPGSGIDAFDPRVIAILPANPGVSFNYPIFNCIGNNSVVMEPDGYTKLFDNLGGSIPGNTNPFKAYFKDQPYRRWSSTGVTSETKRWNLSLAGFGGSMQFKLVVDVSTNFPNPSTPVTDNASEPVKIDTLVGSGLSPDGGSADIAITLLDWQGQSGIGGVLVEAPDLFSGTDGLVYSATGPNPNEYVYTGTITNSLLAHEDEYKILIATWDIATGNYLYNEFTVKVISQSATGNLIWAKCAGGEDWDRGCGITTLSDNSTVVTGFFRFSATFGQGESNQTTLTSDGDEDNDIFIAKYNPDGTLSWAKRAGGSGTDTGYGITRLSDDTIVVTGSFMGKATFGPGEPKQKTLTSSGQYDIFIVKYDQNGKLLKARRAGGALSDCGYGITKLSDNSVVVTGYFDGLAAFGPGEPNETFLTSSGLSDIFIARYDPDGILLWAKRAGGSSSEYGIGITRLSEDNSIVVTGGFVGSAIFGQGEINQTILTAASLGYEDIFIARYNPDGTLAWAKRAGGTGYDIGYGITTLSDNSTVVTGKFAHSSTFGEFDTHQTILTSAGAEDIFIACYNPDGTLSWAKRAGGLSYDRGYAIMALLDNSTVVTGEFRDSATFGPDELNQTILTTYGFSDIFIAKYNPDGTLLWAKQAGGWNGDCGYGITTLSVNSIVVTGEFNDSATFGGGEPNEIILTTDGFYDIFVARFAP